MITWTALEVLIITFERKFSKFSLLFLDQLIQQINSLSGTELYVFTQVVSIYSYKTSV